MKNYLFLIFLIPVSLLGQSKIGLELGTKSGFEYNVFNANERRIAISEEGDTISALQSGFFQRFNFRLNWKTKIKKHQFSTALKTRYDYFPDLSSANLLRPELDFNYTYKLNKKRALFFRSKYLNYRTERIPDDTRVLSPPNAYQRWNVDAGYKFRLKKNNKSQIRVSALQKNYVEDSNSRLSYRAYSVNFQTKHRFRKKKKPSHYLSFELDFAKRFYEDELLEPDEDEEDIRYREWQYHTFQTYYSFASNKLLRWETGLSVQQRLDILDDRFGYLQWGPYVKMEFEKEKFSMSVKVENINRNYTGIQADKSSDDLLEHRYLRVNLLCKYQVNEHWEFVAQGNLRQRWRNYAKTATSFLPYTNAMVSFGVNLKF